MAGVRGLAAFVAAAGVAAAPASGWADYNDRVMNPEGRWGIDVDHGACAASMDLADGSVFTVRAVDGRTTFAVFFAKPIQPGKTGQVRTEAYDFTFAPSFTDDNAAVFYDGDLGGRELAALRLAKQVRVLVDGREVSRAAFEGTGFDGALDGVIACSKGEKGWWGEGAAADAPQGAGETGERPPLAFNAEGAWGLEATDYADVCAAYGVGGEHLSIVLLGALGQVGLALNAEEDLPKGRKGLVETDAFSFAFKPQYDGARYLAADEPFDSQTLFALRRAKSLRVRIDGRTVADMDLEGTGFGGLLESLIACSKGEEGWWGAGAKQP
jgi:hypothetical protein